MKKLIVIVFMLSAALGAFVWYQGQGIDSKDILQINIYNEISDVPEHSYYTNDSVELESIVDLLNTMPEKTSAELDVLANPKKYTMDVIMNNGEMYNYDLNIDLNALKLNIKNHNTEVIYEPNSEQTKMLLSLNGFYSLYETSAPTIALAYSTLNLQTKTTLSQWVYTLADGSEMEKKTQIAADPQNTTVPLSSDHAIDVFSERTPTLMTLKVYEENTLLREEVIENGTFLPNRHDGILRYDIVSQWNKENTNDPFGTSILTFFGNMDLKPELVMDKATATAGDVIVIEIFNVNDNQTPRIEQSLSKDFKLWKSGDRYFGFLAMNYWAKAGDYTLTLIVENDDNITFTGKYPVTIQSKDFNKQYLTVDKTVESSTKNEAAYAEYAEFFTPMRDSSIDKKLWDGTFIQPVEGRISTEFGEMRYVNGSLTSYRHSGVDIAAPRGTEIVAPNGGVVKLSRSLILTGETIVIDHGYGIFSIYFHMDSRSVEAGSNVEKGQLIGTVGSTGFSTGPHLHWTMSHYKTNLSPWLFMERELITFE